MQAYKTIKFILSWVNFTKISLGISVSLTIVALCLLAFSRDYTVGDFGVAIQRYTVGDAYADSSQSYSPIKNTTATYGQQGDADLRVGIAHAKVWVLSVSPDIVPYSFVKSWIVTIIIGLVSALVRVFKKERRERGVLLQSASINS